MPPIHAKQIRIIKMAQRDLGMDDAGYRGLLADLFGVESCRDLTMEQGNRLIDEFQRKGFRLVPAPRPERSAKRDKKAGEIGRKLGTERTDAHERLIRMATAAEFKKIDEVAALIPWRLENGKTLFFAKRLGLKDGRVRTSGEAYRAIEALKKMFENGMAKTHGKAWWTMQHKDPRVMEYIRRHCPEEWK